MLFNNLSNSKAEENHLHSCAVFGDFVLDFDRGSLQKDGIDLPLRPKSFEVLTYLVSHHGILVSKEELLSSVWPNVIVTEDSLIQCLIEIRKVLGDSKKEMIVTMPKRGYLFDLGVESGRLDNHQLEFQDRSFFAQLGSGAWTTGGALVLIALLVAGWWQLQATWQLGGNVPANRVDVMSGKPNGVQSIANQHYEQGRFFHFRRADGDLDRAILEYQKALAVDPDMALAWVGLGGVYAVKTPESSATDPDEYIKYLKQALELDPNNAEANMRMSRYYFWRGNSEKHAEHLELALKHGQNDALVLSMVAGDLMYQLRIDDALILQRRVVELDPTSAMQHEILATYYFYAGRFENARTEYAMMLKLSPESKSYIAPNLLKIALSQNQLQEAEQWVLFLNEDTPDAIVALAMFASSTGDHTAAEQHIALLESDNSHKAAVKLAEYYAFQNDQETSFKWLNETLVRLQKSPSNFYACSLMAEASYSPFLKSLQHDPKWFDWNNKMVLLVPPQINFKIAALVQSD